MPKILSISTMTPPHVLKQEETMTFAKQLFHDDFPDIERLLNVFHNGQIHQRYFSAPLDWFSKPHSLSEKNDLYCQIATEYGQDVIQTCLSNETFLTQSLTARDIDAFYFVSTTGLSTPSIDAKIMNRLPFDPHTKRIPMWGLGCAGGASGLSRAYDYCKAYPKANVIVLCVELCSLTFQYNDRSKSNLIGTSLFADGLACVLVTGDDSELNQHSRLQSVPMVIDTQSTLMPDSEEVMGWDVRDEGLYVVFSKSIPHIVEKWFKPNAETFLSQHHLSSASVDHFIAHPGGKKVLEAYEKALDFSYDRTKASRDILRDFGNMSSPTVLFVLETIMEQKQEQGDLGLVASLGPGFSSELLLVRWEKP